MILMIATTVLGELSEIDGLIIGFGFRILGSWIWGYDFEFFFIINLI